MAGRSRADLRRLSQEQSHEYKRMLAFVLFLIVTLSMITATFLNPFFMKSQIRTSSNQAVIVRQVNNNFDKLADLLNAQGEEASNLLTEKQTQPIADHIIDYSLGFHWFKVSNTDLAQQILNDIDANIDHDSSSEAQVINNRLKKQKNNQVYLVNQAFNLNVVTLGANIAGLLLVVNIVIIIVTIITLVSLMRDLQSRSSLKALIHTTTGAGMWAGFWLILICGILAIIPVLFNVTTTSFAGMGFLLEISSGIFLEFVIAGVIMYVLCALPWQATTAN